VLVQLAVGDAYGATFEYAPASFVAAGNTLADYSCIPPRPGRYTDDTQMTIAIAEALISGEPWTPENLADRFFNAFHRDPRAGYATRFHALLREVRDGQDLLARLRPNSDKSGAAMRAGPIGLLPTVADVLHHTEVQARRGPPRWPCTTATTTTGRCPRSRRGSTTGWARPVAGPSRGRDPLAHKAG